MRILKDFSSSTAPCFIFKKFIEILIGLDFIACKYLSFLFQESKQCFIFLFHSSIFSEDKSLLIFC